MRLDWKYTGSSNSRGQKSTKQNNNKTRELYKLVLSESKVSKTKQQQNKRIVQIGLVWTQQFFKKHTIIQIGLVWTQQIIKNPTMVKPQQNKTKTCRTEHNSQAKDIQCYVKHTTQNKQMPTTNAQQQNIQ